MDLEVDLVGWAKLTGWDPLLTAAQLSPVLSPGVVSSCDGGGEGVGEPQEQLCAGESQASQQLLVIPWWQFQVPERVRARTEQLLHWRHGFGTGSPGSTDLKEKSLVVWGRGQKSGKI